MSTKMTIKLGGTEKACKFVTLTRGFESDIDIICGRYVFDAKSLMAILSLDLSKFVDVNLHSDDENEIKRFKEVLSEFVDKWFK